MKIANFSPLLLLVAALSIALTGCKKTPKSPTPIFGPRASAPNSQNPNGPLETGPAIPITPGPVSNPTGPGAGEQGALAARPGSLADYIQDHEIFKQDTVYFDFDKYNVKPGELPKVKSVVDYLKGQPSFSVLIEGNCDERGTPEYNRALGERRALAIRESLVQLGLSGDRIQTVSYGEDKPADPGHNDSAWAKNRRGDFVLLKPKGMASGQ